MNSEAIKRIIEGILFAMSEPVSLRKLREALEFRHPVSNEELLALVHEIQADYIQQNRGFRLEEIGQGYLLRTCEDIHPFIEVVTKNVKSEKLSPSAAEVLAIIAYRQPITRPQIDEIRGVDSSGCIYALVERQLIEPLGKLEVPGRPTLFGVTKRFLQHFGLREASDLPKI